MKSETVRLSTGAEIYAELHGGGAELVVFLHAVGGDHRSWKPQIEAFSSKYACLAVDFRGHGRSSAPAPISESVTVEAFAADTIELIERLGWRKAHLTGLSMGGAVALEIRKQAPHVVQSLTLANTWAYLADAEGRIAFMRDQLSKMSLRESSAMLIPGLFAPGTPSEIVEEAIEIEGSKNREAFLASWVSMFSRDYRDLLARIDVPLLLIGGSADPVMPTDPCLTDIFSRTAASQLFDIPGGGHFSNLDHPEDFNRLLRIHLNRARADESTRIDLTERQSKTVPAETVAEAIMGFLPSRGVECFFSNSGTDFTPIIDALAKFDGEPWFDLKTVAAPHENTAIAMAHGHYLLSGKPQAVMAHVNVGTANMGLGIMNASRSRIPMLVLAGKTPWYESDVTGCRTNFVQWGQDTFDQGAYFREFTKWDYELKGAFNLETILDRALAVGESNPAGPVYLTLPKEVLCERIDSFSFSSVPRQQPSLSVEPSAEAIDRVARLIRAARNPLVITAELGRYRGGPEALIQLAERHAVPVVEHGKRNFFNFPTEHPMHLGFSPSPYVEHADLVVAVESHVPWIPALSGVKTPPTVVQIGVDPLCGNIPMRSFPVDCALAGNPAATLRKLGVRLDELGSADARAERYAELSSEHDRLCKTARDAARSDAGKPAITKRYLSLCIGDIADDETVIFNEYNLEPQLVPRRLTDSWFENSIASGLGWSLGAALGAQLARPELTMVVTLGDGSYLFNTPLSAHHAAAAYRLPVIFIVFNDTAWSTIKKSYLGTTPDAWGPKKDNFPLCNFDVRVKFELLAEACGGVGLTVDSPAELPATLRKAFDVSRNERRHVLVNVICERDA